MSTCSALQNSSRAVLLLHTSRAFFVFFGGIFAGALRGKERQPGRQTTSSAHALHTERDEMLACEKSLGIERTVLRQVWRREEIDLTFYGHGACRTKGILKTFAHSEAKRSWVKMFAITNGSIGSLRHKPTIQLLKQRHTMLHYEQPSGRPVYIRIPHHQ